jgi:hypothetical protein
MARVRRGATGSGRPTGAGDIPRLEFTAAPATTGRIIWSSAAEITVNLDTNANSGGPGADTFVYQAVSDSTAAAPDSINDFSYAESDRINLATIDADGNAGNGDTAFTLLGGGVFTGAGQEVRVVASGWIQMVQPDLNGDNAADMAIAVVSVTTLVASDFVL